MALDGAPLALAILAVFGLGMAIAARYKRSSPRLSGYVSFAVVGLAFAAAALPAREFSVIGFAGTSVEQRLRIPLRLGFLALCLLESLHGIERRQRIEKWSHMLLSVCGAVLALSATDLVLVWSGMALYAVAGCVAQADARVSPRDRRALAAAATAPVGASVGLTLLLLSKAPMGTVALAGWLAHRVADVSPVTICGLVLLLGTIAASSGLLPPYRGKGWRARVLDPVLGLIVLLRVGSAIFASMRDVWCLSAMALGLVAVLWGVVGFVLTGSAVGRMRWVGICQRGFVLGALGLALTPLGFVAAVAGLCAFVASEGILALNDRTDEGAIVPREADQRPHRIWDCTRLLAVASAAAAPLTPGFAARVRLIYEVDQVGMRCIAAMWLGCAVAVACLTLYQAIRRHDMLCPAVAWTRDRRMSIATLSLATLILIIQPMLLPRWVLSVIGY